LLGLEEAGVRLELEEEVADVSDEEDDGRAAGEDEETVQGVVVWVGRAGRAKRETRAGLGRMDWASAGLSMVVAE